ncbi:MAG: hypothetical protein SF052_19935 [Bacteroidia bacterium]|nr:hypothetical protein [Bacteroidia bacterium]
MNLSVSRTIFTFSALSVLLASCSLIEKTDKIIAPEWSPEVALPLVNTHISVEKALDKVDTGGWLQISATGDLALLYEAHLATLSQSDFPVITLPDIPVVMPDSQLTLPFPIEQLQRITLKSGSLDFDYQSSLSGEYEVFLRLDDLWKDGSSFVVFLPLSPSGSGSATFDLTGYTFVFSDDSVRFACYARHTGSGQTVTLDGASMLLKGMDYSYLEGNIPYYAFSNDADSITTDIFKQIKVKSLGLADPSLTFIFDNSFGVPVEITSLISASSSDGMTTVPLGHDGLAGGINLLHPQISEVGQSKITEITINKTNSNITDIISALPEVLTYQFGMIANPNGNAFSGFITDSSSLSVGISAEIPLEGQVEDLILEDTLEVDLSDLDIVQAGGFKLITENALPVEAVAQVYFLDSQGELLDSLFDVSSALLSSPETGADGAVVTPGTQTLSVNFSEERFSLLPETRKIRIRAIISTAGGGVSPVKFRVSDQIGIKLGVTARINP